MALQDFWLVQDKTTVIGNSSYGYSTKEMALQSWKLNMIQQAHIQSFEHLTTPPK